MQMWHSHFPFAVMLWNLNPVMLHEEVRMAWGCLSNCDHDKMLSQRLSGRSSSGCGTSVQRNVHEEPKESPPWPHLLPDLLVTCVRSWSRWWFIAAKAMLEPRPFLMLKFQVSWCWSPSHTLTESRHIVKLLSRETMERELNVKCLFDSFYWKCLTLLTSLSHTQKS